MFQEIIFRLAHSQTGHLAGCHDFGLWSLDSATWMKMGDVFEAW